MVEVQQKTTVVYDCFPGAPCLTAAETGLLHGYTCPNHRADPGWLSEEVS